MPSSRRITAFTQIGGYLEPIDSNVDDQMMNQHIGHPDVSRND